MALANNRIEFVRKKLALLSYLSHNEAKILDNLFPIDVLKNHPPIINPVNLGGLNLETKLNPIGLKNNSPTVITP